VLLEDPEPGLATELIQYGQVIPAEAFGLVPATVVFVDPGDGDVVANAAVGGVLPDRDFDPGQPKLVDRLALRLLLRGSLGLLGFLSGLGFGHCVSPLK